MTSRTGTGLGSVGVAVHALRMRERELATELATVQSALRALATSAAKGPVASPTASATAPKRKHNMSAAGRAAIAKAARKRWAAWRKAKAAKKK